MVIFLVISQLRTVKSTKKSLIFLYYRIVKISDLFVTIFTIDIKPYAVCISLFVIFKKSLKNVRAKN